MGPRGAALPKPGMLIGGVVRHEIEDDFKAARVRSLKERIEVRQGTEKRMDRAIVGDVVTKVPHRRWKDGRDPDRVHPEIDKVVKAARNPFEIANAIRIRILER